MDLTKAKSGGAPAPGGGPTAAAVVAVAAAVVAVDALAFGSELHALAQVESVRRLVGSQVPAFRESGSVHVSVVAGIEHPFQEQSFEPLVRADDVRRHAELSRSRHDGDLRHPTGHRHTGGGRRCPSGGGGSTTRCRGRAGRRRGGVVVSASGDHDEADDDRGYKHQPNSFPHCFPSSCLAIPRSAHVGPRNVCSRYSLALVALGPSLLCSVARRVGRIRNGPQ